MKKMFAAVSVGLALSVVGVGVSAGLASPADAATPSVVAGSAATTQHPLRAWVRAHRKVLARHTVEISAKTIGISPKSLTSSMRSGQSIAQVAETHNVDVQTVMNALVDAGDTQVGNAVTNHKLTPAQGSKIEAALPKVVTRVVDHVYGRHAS
jgi:ABC-type glycerol-3-phosphate transport system substrate-binding protein